MPGLGQRGQQLAGAVGGVGQHLHRPVRRSSCRPAAVDADRGVGCVRAGGLGQRAVGDQPGVRLDRHVGLEPVLAAVRGLVRVPGLGVHGGDDPVRGDLPGDPPPPVGAVGALGRFHVLPGDQRQQRHRLGRLRRPSSLLGQVPEQPVRVARPARRPARARACLVVPGDRRLARIVRSHARVQCSAITAAAPGTSRPPGGSPRSAGSPCPGWRPRRRAPWSPTPGGSCPQHPGLGDHRLDRVEDPVRPLRGGQPAPPVVNVVGWNPGAVTASPHAAFHRRSNVDRLHRLGVRQPVQRLQHDHRGHHSAGTTAGPARTGTDQRTSLREQLPAVLGQEREHAARRQQMPATDSTSSNLRCGSARPCTRRSSQPPHRSPRPGPTPGLFSAQWPRSAQPAGSDRPRRPVATQIEWLPGASVVVDPARSAIARCCPGGRSAAKEAANSSRSRNRNPSRGAGSAGRAPLAPDRRSRCSPTHPCRGRTRRCRPAPGPAVCRFGVASRSNTPNVGAAIEPPHESDDSVHSRHRRRGMRKVSAWAKAPMGRRLARRPRARHRAGPPIRRPRAPVTAGR